jgi:hypothetical protein
MTNPGGTCINFLIKRHKIFLLSLLILLLIYIFAQNLTTQEIEDEPLLEEIYNSIKPEEMIYKAASNNRVLIYGEIHPMAQPKMYLARTIKKLHYDYDYDYLVLEIGDTYQPIIDKYLETGNELLLRKNPWTLFSPWHASEQHIKIYKAVYQINKRTPDNPMKIVCADYNPEQYGQNSELLKSRDKHIMENINNEILEKNKEANIIILIGAYHALKNNVWEYMKEYDPYGIVFKEDPLGVHLNKLFPDEVFSFYIDGIIPDTYDENGYFLSKIGILYKKHLITMAPIPFALFIDNSVDTKFNIFKEVPISGNYDGYIFVGEFEELKYIDVEQWKNKKNKD